MTLPPEQNFMTPMITVSLSKPHAYRSWTIAILVGMTLAVTTGCPKKKSGVDPSSLGPTGVDTSKNTPTASITADPVSVTLGQTVVLNWKTTNATVATIDGIGQVDVNGTQTVAPSSSTNFHLVAKGDGGTTEANVRVTVRPATASTSGTSTLDANSRKGIVTDEAFHAAVQDAFFDYDSLDLRPDAQASVAQAATYLQAHPDIRVLIGGYCDERGSAEYNLALGENRANSAKAALVTAGIATDRIRVISYGKEKQFCTESTEACYQENRRAQFTIDR